MPNAALPRLRKSFYQLAGLLTGACLLALPARAQLSGTKTIPGDYATISAAFSALNSSGVGASGVTFNVASGHTETGVLPVLTATGTASGPIVFQKSGSGTSPRITAGVGTSTTLDGIVRLSGADYVTFDGIDLLDPTSNNTATKAMEFGYALFRVSATNACQNVTIRNCTITLQRAQAAVTGSLSTPIGIYGANSTPTSTTALVSTSGAGGSKNHSFTKNTIQNVATGIHLLGTDASNLTRSDQGSDLGGSTAGTAGVGGTGSGNLIQNFNGSASVPTFGIRLDFQRGAAVRYNSLANAGGGGANSNADLYGVYVANTTGGTYTLSNNTVALQHTANARPVTGLYCDFSASGLALTLNSNTFALSAAATASGEYACMWVDGDELSLTVTGNSLSGTGLNTTGDVYFLYASTATPDVTFQNNVVDGFSKGGTSGTFYGYYNFGSPTAGTATLSSNQFKNITLAGATSFEGIFHATHTDQISLVTDNVVQNVTTGTTTGSSILGLEVGYNGSASLCARNTISNLTGETVVGIYTSNSDDDHITRNLISGLTGNQTTSQVFGVLVYSGTTVTLSNNLIGDLKVSAAATTANNDVTVAGIMCDIFGATTVNAYYNTVNLTASGGGVRFNVTGLYLGSDTEYDLRNNLVVNTSTVGTNVGARVSALRSDAAPTLLTGTDNNLYYVGAATTKTGIFYREDTQALTATLPDYQALVSPREGSSVSQAAPFLATTGAGSTFLHIDPTVASKIESGGQVISGLTADYDAPSGRGPYPLAGQVRGGGTAPDIGADEGDFTPIADAQIVALASPTQTACLGAPQQTVSFTVHNVGVLTIDLTTAPLTLTASASDPALATTTFPAVVLNTGTLAPGATRTVTVSTTYAMSAVGTYAFSASLTGDPYTLNNSFAKTLTVGIEDVVPAQTVVAPTTVCAGASFTLAVTGALVPGGNVAGSKTETPPLAIPDNLPAGATSTLTLSGAGAATVTAGSVVRVTLNLTHTFDGDLNIFLIDPSGTRALELSTGNGSSGANYTNTVLSTAATNVIGSAGNDTAPFTGTYQPEGTLTTAPTYSGIPATALVGAAIDGAWSLKVIDAAGADVGTIDSWSLRITAAGIPAYTHSVTGPGTISAVAYSGASNETGTVTITGAPLGTNLYTVTTTQGSGCATTTTQSVVVTSTLTWTGATNSDWYEATNWSPACVPSSTLDAVVPTGAAPAPAITSGVAQVRDLTVQGSSNLSVSGTGNLDVYGTFTTASAASFTATAGTTAFVGSGAQPVPAGAYHRVALTGATAKVLAGAATLGDALDLTAGRLQLGNFDLTLADNQAVVGADANHFVITNGTGRLGFAGVGAGETVTFPVGTTAAATDYTPATLTNNGTADTFRGRVSSTVPVGASLDPSGSHVVLKTWDISEDVAGGSVAELTLAWNTANEGSAFNRSQCTVAHFTGGVWDHYLRDYAAATNLGGGRWARTRVSQLTSFSPFAVEDGTQPLPVELLFFAAKRRGDAALLTWATASEHANAGFEVQVKRYLTRDGEFHRLGFVESQASGESKTRLDYSFLDDEAGKVGTRVYRLLQRDLDGTTSLSQEVAVTFDGDAATAVAVWPNPLGASAVVRVQISAPVAQAAELTLLDALGREVMRQSVAVAAGRNEVPLSLPAELATGTYTLRVQVGGQLLHTRLLRQ